MVEKQYESGSIKRALWYISNTRDSETKPVPYIHSSYSSFHKSEAFKEGKKVHDEALANYRSVGQTTFDTFKKSYLQRMRMAGLVGESEDVEVMGVAETFLTMNEGNTRKQIESAIVSQLNKTSTKIIESGADATEVLSKNLHNSQKIKVVAKELQELSENERKIDAEKMEPFISAIESNLGLLGVKNTEQFTALLKSLANANSTSNWSNSVKKKGTIGELALSDSETLIINSMVGKSANGGTISKTVVENVLKTYKTVIYGLKTGKHFAQYGEKYTMETLANHLAQYMSSTLIGEGMIGNVVEQLYTENLSDPIYKGLLLGEKNPTQSPQLAGMLGATSMTNVNGFQDPLKESKIAPLSNTTSKPDVVGSTAVSVGENGSAIHISMEYGISIKNYLGMKTDGKTLNSISSVSLVSGKSLLQTLKAIYGASTSENIMQAYLHNTYGYMPEELSRTDIATQYKELKEMIWGQYGHYLISGTGQGTDFSQFLYINGTYYSVYSIIEAMQTYKGGGSQGRGDSPVHVSFGSVGGMPEWIESNNKSKKDNFLAWRRSVQGSQIFNKLKIDAKFHLDPQFIINAN